MLPDGSRLYQFVRQCFCAAFYVSEKFQTDIRFFAGVFFVIRALHFGGCNRIYKFFQLNQSCTCLYLLRLSGKEPVSDAEQKGKNLKKCKYKCK